MPLPNIPGGSFGGMPLPERPKSVKPEPVKESPKPEIHKPFEKTQFIPPQEFVRRIQTSPKVFHEIAGDSQSTLKELLNKISGKMDQTSSLTEPSITRLQKEFDIERLNAEKTGRSKDAFMAGKARDLLERFKKGEL